jgi:hypothetical protein
MAQVQIMLPEERTTVLHVGRTTLAAVISQALAHALHMPEPYWATVTTIVGQALRWNHGSHRHAGGSGPPRVDHRRASLCGSFDGNRRRVSGDRGVTEAL